MFKSHNKMLMSICIVFCLFLGSPVFAYSGGSGEPNDPYQIANADDLLELASDTEDYNNCFILIDDINMAGQVFTTAIIAADTVAGNYSFEGTAFTGTFDGNGCKITNFTIDGGSNCFLGLFGRIDSGGSVKNLGLENFSVSGSSGYYYVGGLVGSNYNGSISNCYSTGTVSGSTWVGGLVGRSEDGSISNCYSTDAVSGSQYVGGLVGSNIYYSSISNCYATGAVSGSSSSSRVGGLVGLNMDNSSISNCYSTGAVSGAGYVGGLAGNNWLSGGISNCYSTGAVSGGSGVGGLVGNNLVNSTFDWLNSKISNCYATGAVTGEYNVGGLVGYNRNMDSESGGDRWDSRINNCYATGTVIGKKNVGGLVGRNESDGGSIIRNCYSTGAVSGSDNNIGGLVGLNEGEGSSIICGCFWDIETSGQTSSAGGEGRTTAEMYSIDTFYSWACGEIWTIDDGNDYPRLVWQGLPGQLITIASMSIFGGGSGTAEEPFLIYTAEQLNVIGLLDCAMNMHFKLMSDIDLSCFPENRFNIIGNLDSPFTGVFDGNGHIITNLTIDAGEESYGVGLFGCTDKNSVITNLGVEDVNIFGRECVGGLVGSNANCDISNCYSTGVVSGGNYVGGLVGRNYGSISDCYSTGGVSGSRYVGGLVGYNGSRGGISNCYSTGAVSGSSNVGGLVGYRSGGSINNSFWDVNTSGQTTSAGGTGKTTAEMQDIDTFLAAGWDFAGETANGTEDIWTICDGFTYPTFVYQNAQPIADAGPSQTVYAWLDGIAEVELDGSASSDIDECNGLIFHWTWTIDDNTYEANGVNPVIELPAGVHTIELIVNDGLMDSEPNYVDVNVIAPLETSLRIMPTIVNRASNIRNIIAVMDMPKGIKRGDISKEPFVLFPADGEEGIEAVRQYVLPMLPCWQHRIRVVALFDKDDLTDLIPNNGRAKLQVVGELNTGQCVFGEDDIWLIGKRRPFWPWCRHK